MTADMRFLPRRSDVSLARWRGPLTVLAFAVSLSWAAGALAAGDGAAPSSSATAVLDDYGKRLQDRSRPEKERLQIIELFGQWATAQVRAPLLAALGDPLPSIREAAARALGWPGNREAVPALLDRLQATDETTGVKAAALQALGRIGDDSGRAPVVASSQDADSKGRGRFAWWPSGIRSLG